MDREDKYKYLKETVGSLLGYGSVELKVGDFRSVGSASIAWPDVITMDVADTAHIAFTYNDEVTVERTVQLSSSRYFVKGQGTSLGKSIKQDAANKLFGLS